MTPTPPGDVDHEALDQGAFNPVWLRSFLAVASSRSFTRAANRLGLSQPAVSQQVRRLEDAAGRQLLVRDTRSVRLTDNGEAMAGFARTILAAQDEAVRYFSGSAMRGRLRFGAADELALGELPSVLREFRQSHPQLSLELTVTQSGTLRRRLDSGQLDLIFVNRADGADAADGRVVGRDRLVWVAPPGTVVDGGQPLPIVTYAAPSWSRSAALAALDNAGRAWRITCNTREVNGILAATRAGLGLCVLAASRIPPDLRIVDADLPTLPDVEMVLLTGRRAAPGPADALARAIANLAPSRLRKRGGDG